MVTTTHRGTCHGHVSTQVAPLWWHPLPVATPTARISPAPQHPAWGHLSSGSMSTECRQCPGLCWTRGPDHPQILIRMGSPCLPTRGPACVERYQGLLTVPRGGGTAARPGLAPRGGQRLRVLRGQEQFSEAEQAGRRKTLDQPREPHSQAPPQSERNFGSVLPGTKAQHR